MRAPAPRVSSPAETCNQRQAPSPARIAAETNVKHAHLRVEKILEQPLPEPAGTAAHRKQVRFGRRRQMCPWPEDQLQPQPEQVRDADPFQEREREPGRSKQGAY